MTGGPVEPQQFTVHAHLLFETGERATMPFRVRAAESFEAARTVLGMLEKLRDDGGEFHLEQLVLTPDTSLLVTDVR